jgi:hypothetical protein
MAPLTGALFVVLAVIAFAVFGGSTPDSTDPAQTVQSFYSDHYSNQVAAAILLAFGAAMFTFFAACVSQTLREAGGTGRLANAVLIGGALTTGGFLLVSGIHLALTEAAHHAATISAALTLNVLDGNDWPVMTVSIALFTFAAGLAAVRHGGLPKWLGWTGIVFGLATFTPAGFFGFLACGLWVLVTSIVMAFTNPVEPAAEAPIGGREEAVVTDASAAPRSPSPIASGR